MDKFSSEKRSLIMSKISGKETKPEILVRKHLFANGFRYRKNVKELPGKPDILLPKYKTVIFINGCFWHGHENCKRAKLPTSNTEFWQNKIGKTKIRDKSNIADLENMGYNVITVWQCELTASLRETTFNKLIKMIIQ